MNERDFAVDRPCKREGRLLEVFTHAFASRDAINRKQNAVVQGCTEDFEVGETGGWVTYTAENELLGHKLKQDLWLRMSSENLLDRGKDLSKDRRYKGHCEDWCYDEENQTRFGGRKGCDEGHCGIGSGINNEIVGVARKLTQGLAKRRVKAKGNKAIFRTNTTASRNQSAKMSSLDTGR